MQCGSSARPALGPAPPRWARVTALLCSLLRSLWSLPRPTDPLVSALGNSCVRLSAHSYSHDTLLEVAPEGVRLVVLDLAVLHGAASQVVVQLCGVDGSTALLILGGVLPDPKVDVLGEEAAHSPGLGGSRRGG